MKLVISLTLIIHLTSALKIPLVNIPSLGQIEGTYQTTTKGRNFYGFEGVPYARPPTGKFRFREPAPMKPWHGIWKAGTIYKCLQNYQYTAPGADFVIGDEDCLYLNIYTPNLDVDANLDVVVYIHGGAFMFNWGGLQGPQLILDKDVVYINLNYRLGPLGFLSTEDDILPGNNGLKDQIYALRWIKDHIRHFGGNPNSVTIVGMSAGGASVHFHYLSPKSRGLFHKGLSQSGTMLNPWVLVEKPLQKTKKLAALVGCPSTHTKQMVKCLSRRPGRQIVAAVKDFHPWLYNPFSPFGVVVDSWATDPVLPKHPYKLLKDGEVADLPWIASYVSSEGLYPGIEFYSSDKYLKDIDSKWDELLPHILDYNYTVDSTLQHTVSKKIRDYYLGDESVTQKTFSKLVRLLSERLFDLDIQKAVKIHSSVVESHIFCYYFAYRGAHSKSEARSRTNKNFGASHGDDTSYIFQTNVDTVSTEDDRLMVELMVEMLTSFAKTSKPKVPLNWESLSKNVKDPLACLRVESPKNLTVESSVVESAKFWASLPIKENEKLFSIAKEEL